MFITEAYAQAATGAAATNGSNILITIVPFIIVFGIMYFLIIRPQRQRQKQQQDMIRNVRRGDTIITTGGLIGTVAKVTSDSEIEVRIADGVQVRVVRAMIQEVRAKGEPAKDTAA